MLRELGYEYAVPATDVERSGTVVRQLGKDPWVECVVVAPRVACVEVI